MHHALDETGQPGPPLVLGPACRWRGDRTGEDMNGLIPAADEVTQETECGGGECLGVSVCVSACERERGRGGEAPFENHRDERMTRPIAGQNAETTSRNARIRPSLPGSLWLNPSPSHALV